MRWQLHHGHCLEVLRGLASDSVDACVTSPPYFGIKRDYGDPGQDWPEVRFDVLGERVVAAECMRLGYEKSPLAYIGHLVAVFREVRRILKPNGLLWLNLGDTWAKTTVAALGAKRRDLLGIPWLAALALRSDGWWLRAENIWAKPNPMPEGVKDRTTRAHEHLFMFSQAVKYHYDIDALREPHQMKPQRRSRKLARPSQRDKDQGFSKMVRNEPGVDGNPGGRNRRSVWCIVAAQDKSGEHLASMPVELVHPCVLASPRNGIILDPFCGAGTVGVSALIHGRNFIGVDQNDRYLAVTTRRLREVECQGL